jgi:hypothetical protein
MLRGNLTTIFIMSNQETIDSHVDSQSEFGEDFLVSASVMDLNTLGDISPDAL